MGFFSWHQWINRKSRSSRRSSSTRPRNAFRPLDLELLETRLTPATHNWIGSAGDGNWANPLNWSGGAPTGGLDSDGHYADLVFGVGVAAANRITHDNLTPPAGGVILNSITIDASASGYSIDGAPGTSFTLGSTAVSGSPGLLTVGVGAINNTISTNIQLGGPANADQFFTVGSGASIAISGNISGTTGSNLTKEGFGTLTLTGDNSGFTGKVKLDANAGIVNVNNIKALGSGPNNSTTVDTNAQLQVQGNGLVFTEPLLLNGPGINNTGALLNVSGNNTWMGNIELDSDTTLGANAGSLNIAGQIGDLGAGRSLTKEGLGQIIFSHVGGNTYRGLTTINNGLLTVEDPLSLGPDATGGGGTAASGTIVNQKGGETGTLQLLDPNYATDGGGFTVRDEQLTINGTGVAGPNVTTFFGAGNIGALNNAEGNNTWAGNITLGSPLPNGSDVSIGVSAAPVLAPATIDPAGANEAGSTVTITTIAAHGFIAGQTVAISGVGVNGYNGTFTITSVTPTTFSYTDSQSNLAASGSGTATLTFVAQPIAAAGATEVGSVVTIVTTATHGLFVGQTVQISGVGVAGYNGTYTIGSVPTPTSFTYTANLAGLAPSGAGIVTPLTPPSTLTVSGIIGDVAPSSGPFKLTKVDVGELILNNSNTYLGQTDVEMGTLDIRDSQALGPTGKTGMTTVEVGASLALDVDSGQDAHGRDLANDSITGLNGNGPQLGLTIDSPLTLNGTGFNNTGALHSITGINKWVAPIFLHDFSDNVAIGVDADPNASADNLYFTHDYSLTVTGVIADDPTNLSAPIFNKNDPGQLILTGPNTYTSDTFINQGWVTVENPNALGGHQFGLGDTVQPYVYVHNGAALHLMPNGTSSYTFDKNLILAGNGITHPFGLISQKGALMNLGGTNVESGNIQLYNVAGVGVEQIFPASASQLTFTGEISDFKGFTVKAGSAGSFAENSNIIDTGSTGGNILINYSSFAGDDLKIYYPPRGYPGSTPGQVPLFDSKNTVGSGTFGGSPAISYGSAGISSTLVEIVLNQGGGGSLNWKYAATISPTDAGAGGLTKLGSQNLLIQGDGTYTGTVEVAEGILIAQNDSALGRNTSGTALGTEAFITTTTTVDPGAALQLAGSVAPLTGGIAAGIQVNDEHLVLNGPGQQVSVSGSAVLGGSFTLSFNGQTTSALDITDPNLAADMQTALDALSSIGGLTVPGSVTVTQGFGPTSNVFTVVFGSSLTEANNPPITTVASGDATIVVSGNNSPLINLSGDNMWRGPATLNVSSAIDVAPNSRLSLFGSIDDGQNVQTLAVPNAPGELTLTYNGQTTPALNLSSPSLAADIAGALNALSTIGGLSPLPGSVSVTQSTTNPRLFAITFGGALAGNQSAITTAGIVTPNPVVARGAGNTQKVTVPSAGPGLFTLTFNGQTTSVLDLSSPTLGADMAGALNSLSSIGGLSPIAGNVNVTQSGSNRLLFTIAFGGSLTGSQPLLVAAGINTPNPVASATTGSDLLKVDGGELVLGGNNSYRGVTHIGLSTAFGDTSNLPGGLVTIENSGALGATTGGTEVANGSTLQIQGNITIAGENLIIQGTGLGAIPTNVPLRWFNVGPAPINKGQTPGNQAVSGRVTGVAVDPTDPNVIYIATAGGGAWKTKNDGLTWEQLFDSTPVQTVSLPGTTGNFALSFNGATTGTLDLASPTLASDIQAALNGLSSIGGLTPVAGSVTVTQSTTDSLLFTVTFGGALSGISLPLLSGAGLAGTSNPVVTASPTALYCGAIAVDPNDPRIIYLGTGESSGSSDSFYGTGVYRSTDSGQTWTLLTNTDGTNPLFGLAVSKIVVDPGIPPVSPYTPQTANSATLGSLPVQTPTGRIYVATTDLVTNSPVAATPGIYRFDTATTQSQVVTVPTLTGGGTFTLTFAGSTTTSLSVSSPTLAADIKARLAALSSVGGASSVDVTQSAINPLVFTVTFKGVLLPSAPPSTPLSLMTAAGAGIPAPIVTQASTWVNLTDKPTANRLSLVGQGTVIPKTPGPDDDFRMSFPQKNVSWQDLTLAYFDNSNPPTVPPGLGPLHPILYASLGTSSGNNTNAVFRTELPQQASESSISTTWYVGDPGLLKNEIQDIVVAPYQGAGNSSVGTFQLTFRGAGTVPTTGFPSPTDDLVGIGGTAGTIQAALNALPTIGGLGGSVTVILVAQSPSSETFRVTFGGTLAFSPQAAIGTIVSGSVAATESEIQAGSGTDTQSAGEFPAGPFPGLPRNGNIKFSSFVDPNPNPFLHPTFPQVTLYAAITVPEDGRPNQGQLLDLEKSSDGGKDWAPVATLPPNYMGSNTGSTKAMGWYDSTILEVNNHTVFVGGQESNTGTHIGHIFETTNGGATAWTDISADSAGNGPHSGDHALAANGQNVLVGTDGGIWEYNPTTKLWSDRNGNLAITSFNSVSANANNPNNALGGSQGNGVVVTAGSPAWTHTDVADGEGGQVHFDPQNPNIAYAVHILNGNAFLGGNGVLDKSLDGGNTWAVASPPGQNSLPTYAPGDFPFLVDTVNTARLLAGGSNLNESLDGGVTWQTIQNLPLLRVSALAVATYQGNFAADGGFSLVRDTGANTYDPNTIYAYGLGFDFAFHLYVTKDHGQSWADRTPALTPGSLSEISVDPGNRDTVYAVSKVFGGSRIMRTTNAGLTWTDISYNLPSLPTWTVAVDPRTDSPTMAGLGTVYIGNDNGVWQLPGGTTTWARFGAGMPSVQVRHLELNQALDTLTAGTYGRSMFQLFFSDVPPLPSVVPPVTQPVYGALRASSGSSVWAGPVQLVGGGNTSITNDVVIAAAGSQSVQNGISAAQLSLLGTVSDLVPGSNPQLNKFGNGEVILAGANTYGGITEIKEGVLTVKNPQALGATAISEVQTLTFTGAPTTFSLNFNNAASPASFTYNGNSADLANLTTALQSLSTIPPGSLSVARAGTAFTVTFGGILSGFSQPAITATPTSGAGTYTVQVTTQGAGGTIVDPGTALDLKSDLALEKVQLNGNGLLFNGHDQGAFRNVSGKNTFTGTLILNTSSTIGVDSGGFLTIGSKSTLPGSGIGTITDNGSNNNLTKELTGTLIFASANNFGGTMTVNQGALQVQNSLALSGSSTDVKDGAQLQLQTPPAQTVAVSGTVGTFTLTFNGQTTSALAFNATAAQVQAAVNALTSIGGLGGAVAVTLSGSVYSITFQGSLGAANQPPLVATGTGGTTAVVTTGTGTPVIVVGEPLTLSGTGIFGTGAILNTGGNNTWQGPITLTSDPVLLLPSTLGYATIPPVNVAFGSANVGETLTINGPIGQASPGAGIPVQPGLEFGLIKVGPGGLTFAALTQTDNYQGVTTVANGTLRLQTSGTPLGTSTAGTVVNAGAALELDGDPTTVGNSIAVTEPLMLNGYGPAGLQMLAISGTSGTFTLTFNGSTTGPLSVASPTLATDIQTALNGLPSIQGVGGSVSVTQTATGYVVAFGGTLTAGTVPPLTFTAQAGVTVAVSTILRGGQGALRNVSGNNVYSSTITLQTATAIGVDPGTLLTVQGPSGVIQDPRPTQQITLSATAGTFTLTFNGATTGSVDAGSATLASDIQTALNGLPTIGGLAPLAGSVTVTQVGTNNIYTVVFGGSLAQVKVPQITVTSAPGLNVAVTTVQDWPVPAATVAKVGTGTLLLPSANTYSGTTFVNGGILNIQDPAALGAGGPEIQTVSIFGASGTFTLNFNGSTTTPLNILDANLAHDMAVALGALPSVTSAGGTITVTKGTGSSGNVYTVVFGGGLQNTNVAQLIPVNVGGANAVVATLRDGPGGTVVNSGATLQVQNGITVSTENLTLNGTGFNNAGALENISGSTDTWNSPVTLGSNASISVDNVGDILNVSQAIGDGGAGFGITKIGPGTLAFTGATRRANTYTGLTSVLDGALQLNVSGGGAIAGNISVGDSPEVDGTPATEVVQLQQDNQLAATSGVTVVSDGLFDVNGKTQTIGSLAMTGGAVDLNAGKLILGGNVTAASDAADKPALLTDTVGGGSLSLGGATRTFTVNGPGTTGTPDMTVSALIVGATATDGLVKSGSGVLQLTNHETYTGTTAVNAGTLQVDGSLGPQAGPFNPVSLKGGTLDGNGNVGAVTSAAPVAPSNFSTMTTGDNGPGVLTVNGNLAWNAQTNFFVDLAGANPGQGLGFSDQLIVNGTVNLANAKLTGMVDPSYIAPVGNSWVILQSTGAISGIFAQGGNGATVFLGAAKFTVSISNAGPTKTVTLTRLTSTTTTSVTEAPAAGVPNTVYNVTATVTPEVGGSGPIPGNVTFTVSGPASFGTQTFIRPIMGTTATLSLQGLAVGNYTVTGASFVSSDPGISNSQAPASNMPTFRVAKDTTITSTPILVGLNNSNPSVYGQPLTFQVTVSPRTAGGSAGNLVPTGTVSFYDGAATLADLLGTVNLTAGVAQLTLPSSSPMLPPLIVGTHHIQATYSGDTNYINGTSVGALTQVVGKASTTISVASSSSGSAVYGAATITATLTPQFLGVPTGSVTFFVNNGTVTTQENDSVINGVATLNPLPPGSYTSITATYGGDLNFTVNLSSNSIAQTVTKASTSVAVASDHNPSVYGQPVTFSAVISAVSPGASQPGSSPASGTADLVIDSSIVQANATVSGGSVTFAAISNLSVSGTAHTVQVVYHGDTNYLGNNNTLTGGQTVTTASTTTTVTSSANPSVFGQSVTFTATVSASPSGVTPDGTVSWVIDGSTVVSGDTLVNGKDTYTTSTLTVNGAGGHTVQAFYTHGSSNFTDSNGSLPGNQVVNKDGTTTTVSSSKPISTYGDQVTFTATVSANGPGNGTPSGTVTFYLDSTSGTTLGTGTLNQLSPDQAMYQTTSTQLPAGNHTIIAVYAGNGSFVGGQGSTPQAVNQVATTTSDVSTNNSAAVYGQSITLSATVSESAGLGAPTGTVNFYDGAVNSTDLIGPGTLNGSGVASITLPSTSPALPALNAGNHTITAVYQGDVNFSGSTSPNPQFVQSVSQASTSTTVSSDTLPSAKYGQETITATVTDTTSGSTGTPTGHVVFTIKVGSTALASQTVALANGVATLTSPSLPSTVLTELTAGGASGTTYTISAAYQGDDVNGNFTASTSASSVTQTVNQASSNTALTANPSNNQSVAGQQVTFTAVVTPASPGAGFPTSTVTFFNGSTQIGTTQTLALMGGKETASVSISSLAVSPTPYSISAVYAGDGNFITSTSNTVAFTVGQASTTTTVASSAPTSTYGSAVTFTATVAATSPGNGTPTGIVSFYDGMVDNAHLLGTGALNQNTTTDQASYTTTTTQLTGGNHTIIAVYPGDTSFSTSQSSSASTNQVVQTLATTTALSSPTSTPRIGKQITITATVTPAASGLPITGGTVSFTVDGQAPPTMVAVNAAGQATFNVTFSTAGNHTINATYSGDTNFGGSVATTLTENALTQVGGFVAQVYRDLLHREVDPGGLTFWTNSLNQGLLNRTQFVSVLESSTEYRSDVVQGLFLHYLHRQVDAGSVSFFVGLMAQGTTDEQIAAILAGSPEYFHNRGGSTVNGFLDALYSDALNRAVDPGGRQAFTQALGFNVSRQQVAAIVLGSYEYKADLVNGYYSQFLRRGPDGGGLNFFATKMTQGLTDETVIALLVGSDEYFNNV